MRGCCGIGRMRHMPGTSEEAKSVSTPRVYSSGLGSLAESVRRYQFGQMRKMFLWIGVAILFLNGVLLSGVRSGVKAGLTQEVQKHLGSDRKLTPSEEVRLQTLEET